MSDPSYRTEPAVTISLAALVGLTLTLDTNVYADGDLLADTKAIGDAVRQPGGMVELRSLQLLDEDDQGVALDLIFLSAADTFGTVNSAPTITDALARDILGRVSIATADYVDLGGCRIADKKAIGLMLQAAAGSTSLYVAVITRGGTPTYSAGGIKLKLGFVRY